MGESSSRVAHPRGSSLPLVAPHPPLTNWMWHQVGKELAQKFVWETAKEICVRGQCANRNFSSSVFQHLQEKGWDQKWNLTLSQMRFVYISNFQFLRRRAIHFNIRWIHFRTISDEIIGQVKRSKIWIWILDESLFNSICHWQDRRTVGEPVAESQFFQRRLSSLHLNRLIEGTEIFGKYVDKCVDS